MSSIIMSRMIKSVTVNSKNSRFVKKLFGLIIVSLMVSLVAACGRPVSPNVYDACEAGVPSKVVQGVIVAKRKVKIDASSGVGGLAGAAGGAVGGSAIGGGSRGNIVGAIGGAVLGGIVGDAIDKGVNSKKAYEYIIKLRNGPTISIAQAQELEFQVNQPVMVIYGATTRIIPDDTCDDRYPGERHTTERPVKAKGGKLRAAAEAPVNAVEVEVGAAEAGVGADEAPVELPSKARKGKLSKNAAKKSDKVMFK